MMTLVSATMFVSLALPARGDVMAESFNRSLDRNSIDLVNQSFDFVTSKEHGVVFDTEKFTHTRSVDHAGMAQWVKWLFNGQVDRLTSNDSSDAGAIYPTNLTQARLVDVLNGGNDAEFEPRFWVTFNTFSKLGDSKVVSLQKAVIASCPLLPSHEVAYQLVWRYKKFDEATKRFGKTILRDNKGRPL